MTEQIEQLRNIRYIIMISIAVFLLVTLSWSTSRMYYFINALNQIAMVLKQLANGNSSVSMPELEDDPDLSSMVLHLRAYQSLHKKMGEVNEELNSVNKGLEEAVAKRTESLQLEVNERRRDEARLNLFGLAFENTDDALIITDEKANIIYVNDAHSRITGYSPAEVIGKNPRQFKSHHHDEEFYKSMWHDLNSNGSWSGEIWDKRKNGEVFPKWLTINRAVNELNEAEHYIGIFHDISTAKENEIQLEKMAYQDPLTSLYNRSKFFEIINEQLHRYNRYSESFSLVYIDLDYFKPVNDDFGHNIGDAVLIEVAQRIRQCIRDMDIAFRLGGDEFALIIPYLDDQEKIDYVVTRILTAINRPFFIDKYEISISCSIGIASCPTNGIESAGLMHSADQAMYESKDKGRGCYSFSQAN